MHPELRKPSSEPLDTLRRAMGFGEEPRSPEQNLESVRVHRRCPGNLGGLGCNGCGLHTVGFMLAG